MDLVDCAEQGDGNRGRVVGDTGASSGPSALLANNRAGECLLLSLPDELLLAILGALLDAEVPGRAAPATQRLDALSRDDALWQGLYRHRYGPPVHAHFGEFGRGWRWLYRARSQRNPLDGPGCVATGAGHFYCGDLHGNRPQGYGLRVYVERPYGVRADDPRDAFALPTGAIQARTEGSWVGGLQHGRVINITSHERYDGTYAYASRTGQGTCIRPSGHVYRGEYTHGEPSGWGVIEDADGRCYRGRWERGSMHGEGTMTLPDGRSHRGRWADNEPGGWGVHAWPNGQRVEAMWKDGAPHGEGVLLTDDGRCFFDAAEEIFCVGGAEIPADIAPSRSTDEWGGRLKRVRIVPCESAAHRRTAETLYVDGSRMRVFWPVAADDERRSCRVQSHSRVCAAAAIADEAQAAAVGTCMACLSASHMLRPRESPWLTLGNG